MRLSRPISILAFMGLLVAAAAWYAPPQAQTQTQTVAVMLPAETYNLLSQKGEAAADDTGRPRSVVQVIEAFAKQ